MRGEEASVVVAAVAAGKGNYGYNAATGEYGDLVETGVRGSDQGDAHRAAKRGIGGRPAADDRCAWLPNCRRKMHRWRGGMPGGMGGMGAWTCNFMSAPRLRLAQRFNREPMESAPQGALAKEKTRNQLRVFLFLRLCVDARRKAVNVLRLCWLRQAVLVQVPEDARYAFGRRQRCRVDCDIRVEWRFVGR